MRTRQGLERLVFFSDAVVAIAITLLVLPLAEGVPEAVARHASSVEVISENLPAIFVFLLSFAVIAQFWRAHHQLFERIDDYRRPLVLWNLLWLLTIVLLPFVTEMAGSFGGDDRFAPVFYIAVVLGSSVCLSVLTLIARANPDIAAGPGAITGRLVAEAVSTTVLLAIALVVTVVVPGARYYSLLLLLLLPAVSTVRRRTAPRS
ncbi:TMEM175 family protein [Amycolatopsis suaedae]|uniref:TMEM175 family protein n=1 Tax=Amycolatopsis suaedae TaxID=2510978 RepID=UPI0013EF3722|nr:TMEM175 family protein [Amycolatopsis suaedae]